MTTRERVLVTVVLAAIVFAASTPVGDLDLGWRIVHGRAIVAHGSLPASAPNIALAGEHPFRSNDTFADVALALAYDGFGFAGVAILRVLLVFAIASALIFALLRDGASVLQSAVLTLLIVAGASFRLFVERAYLFGELALVLFLAVLFTTDWTSNRSISALVAIQLVWTRLHGNATLGPLLAAVFLLTAEKKRLLRAAFLAALLLAALSTGRLGPAALGGGVVWEALAAEAGEIAEWRATTLHQLFVELPAAGIAVAITLALIAFGAIRERRRTELAIALLALAIGLRAIRFIPELLLLTALPAARALRSLRAAHAAAGAAIGTAGFALLVYTVTSDGVGRPAFRERRAWYPHAAARILNEGPAGPICSTFELASWFTLTTAPHAQPYVDGRMITVYPPERLTEWFKAEDDRRAFEALDAREGFVACAIAYPDPRFAAAFTRPRWALVQLDDVTATFVRRDRADPRWLEQRELNALDLRDPLVVPTSSIARASLARDLDRAEALTDERFLLTAIRARLAPTAAEQAALAAQALQLFPGAESLRWAGVDPIALLRRR